MASVPIMDVMSIELSSITITTFQLPKMLSFYEHLGIKLQVVKVDKGSQFHKGHLGPFEFVLCQAIGSTLSDIPRLQISVVVANCAGVTGRLVEQGFDCVMDPADLQGRITSIFRDPDGNTIEIIQK